MSNIEQEHFYYVDPGIGEKGRGCPYTFHKDGHDVRSFIIPPKGYELTGFKLEPYPEDKFYDGKIVAQFRKIPFSTSLKRKRGQYLLSLFSFLSVIAVLAFFFTKRSPKHSTQHFMQPNTEIANMPVDSTEQVQDDSTSSMTLAENNISEEPVEEIEVVEEVAKEEKLEEATQPTENVVEPSAKENEIVQAPIDEPKPEQETQPTTAPTKDQFHQELWDLIHRKETNMRTYHDLYKKYKKLNLKSKEYYYLYLTILENTRGFETWKNKLVRIPDNELKSINTINELKQKLEAYE